MASNWSNLPHHILDSVVDKSIPPYVNYIGLFYVCKSWRSVAIANPKLRPRKLPLLMVPANENCAEQNSLHDMVQRKTFDFQLTVSYKWRYAGCSHGWLAASHADFTVTLTNPFKGKTIHLPSVDPDAKPCSENDRYGYYVHKVILSADPSTNPDNYVVVALFGGNTTIAIIRAGEDLWTYTQRCLEMRSIDDIVFKDGRIYALAWRDAIISIDFTRSLQEELIIPPSPTYYYYKAIYMLKSSKGDLLVVHRIYKEYKTVKFKVFKLLQHLPSEAELVEVKDLGGDSLFLGGNDSMSFDGLEFPDCQPNCIYFTGSDHSSRRAPTQEYWPHEVGIFNLKDERFGQHYVPNPRQFLMQPATWRSPTFARRLFFIMFKKFYGMLSWGIHF